MHEGTGHGFDILTGDCRSDRVPIEDDITGTIPTHSKLDASAEEIGIQEASPGIRLVCCMGSDARSVSVLNRMRAMAQRGRLKHSIDTDVVFVICGNHASLMEKVERIGAEYVIFLFDTSGRGHFTCLTTAASTRRKVRLPEWVSEEVWGIAIHPSVNASNCAAQILNHSLNPKGFAKMRVARERIRAGDMYVREPMYQVDHYGRRIFS